MNQSDANKSAFYSPFSITFTKEGQLVIRVPAVALKYLLALLALVT